MILHDLYAYPERWGLALTLLAERQAHENISHHTMPGWAEHCAFVRSRPYPHWYWFETARGNPAGCVYLTRAREIGVGVLMEHRQQGLAEEAVAAIMQLHPGGRFLANINPANGASLALFHKLGFDGPVQVTLEKA